VGTGDDGAREEKAESQENFLTSRLHHRKKPRSGRVAEKRRRLNGKAQGLALGQKQKVEHRRHVTKGTLPTDTTRRFPSSFCHAEKDTPIKKRQRPTKKGHGNRDRTQEKGKSDKKKEEKEEKREVEWGKKYPRSRAKSHWPLDRG